MNPADAGAVYDELCPGWREARLVSGNREVSSPFREDKNPSLHIREETMTWDRIRDVQAHIRASIADMRPLHDRPEEEFPVTEDAGVCRSCPYKKVCPDKPLK